MIELSTQEANTETTAGHLFKLVRTQGPLTASDLARLTGYSKSTVSVNLEKLIDAGFVTLDESKGAKKNLLRISQQMGFVVGVEIDQRALSVGVFDLNGELQTSARQAVDLLREGPDRVLASVAQCIDELVASSGRDPRKLIGLGVGVPGPVDFARGVPINPPVMPGWDHFPVANYFAERFHCPAFVDNDVNLLALAERDRGRAQDAANFLYLKAGWGIGGGLVIDGQLFRGSRGAAGDIGHIGLDGNPTPCPCGNKGCLEVVAGAAALLAAAQSALPDGPRDLKALALAAAGGDQRCTQLIMESGHNIGTVLAKLVNFFNPSMIVLGGELAGLGERYLASIRESIYHRSTPLATSDLVVKKTLLGEEGGMQGAAVLVLDEILSHEHLLGFFGGAHA